MLCGFVASGKTTYARHLRSLGAQRLSIDQAVFDRYGAPGRDYPPERYPAYETKVRAELDEQLVELLRAGRPVTLDYGFWSRAGRERYKRRIDSAGGQWRLLYFEVPLEVIRERLAKRNPRTDANALFVDEPMLEEMLGRFQAPSGEGEEIVALPSESSGWDESLYAGSAPFYAVGRMPYPAAVAQALGDGLGLDRTQRLLDVGCGPGSLTLLLAPLVASAIGIDADEAMIEQAASAGRRAGASNVSWRRRRAEELPGDLGKFELVTFAQSFHWMDRAAVAAAVAAMLTPSGALVLVHATTHRGDSSTDPLGRPRPPYEQIDALVRRYLGPVRRAGRGSLPAGPPGNYEAVLEGAGFAGPRRIEVPAGAIVTRTSDELLAATFSLSSSTPHLFGSDRDRFERGLRELLAGASPDGKFAERRSDIALDIWHPRA